MICFVFYVTACTTRHTENKLRTQYKKNCTKQHWAIKNPEYHIFTFFLTGRFFLLPKPPQTFFKHTEFEFDSSKQRRGDGRGGGSRSVAGVSNWHQKRCEKDALWRAIHIQSINHWVDAPGRSQTPTYPPSARQTFPRREGIVFCGRERNSRDTTNRRWRVNGRMTRDRRVGSGRPV